MRRSDRVPDGKELYSVKTKKRIENPLLDAIVNNEVDNGIAYESDVTEMRVTLFYSLLQDNTLYNVTTGIIYAPNKK